MEKGFTRCPVCRTQRFQRVVGINESRHGDDDDEEEDNNEITVRVSSRGRPRWWRVPPWVSILIYFLYMQMIALCVGYFMCFLIGGFSGDNSVPPLIVLLAGNVGLIFSYVCLAGCMHVSGRDRQLRRQRQRFAVRRRRSR